VASAAALAALFAATSCDFIGSSPAVTTTTSAGSSTSTTAVADTTSSFGSIPGLLGRRLGGWRGSRRSQLRGLAVESFLDGWVNEGAAAALLRERAEDAASPDEKAALAAMAEDEQRHADLAKAVVTWCFDQEPAAVGRALGKVAPVPLAA